MVGARCAGSATATALARAGRRVVALDRARFPADTLSTHLLFLGGVVELQRLGALERVLELGPPKLTEASMGWGPFEAEAGYTPVDGHRLRALRAPPGAGRRAGGHRPGGRGAGARAGDRAGGAGRGRRAPRACAIATSDGREHELRAPLVVGADGRRSAVARAMGADDPELESPNGRACYFAYWRDGGGGSRSLASQWRQGRELVTAFPCDDGLVLVLLMPPVERADEFADDLAGEYDRTVAAVPQLAGRLRGATRASKVRHTTSTASFFRRACGRGWALPGDAGHFKDPVTAQGIRDAHALRPAAGRAGGAGAGRSAPAGPGAAALGAAARPRVPAHVRVDQPAGARRGDGRAGDRAVPARRATIPS